MFGQFFHFSASREVLNEGELHKIQFIFKWITFVNLSEQWNTITDKEL